ncbi:MAG TPA: hypothetical protein VE091_01335, partial [Gemmatimonadales bacterium]|nr:hypothetical protein [Gemmatimonadales bacterium]
MARSRQDIMVVVSLGTLRNCSGATRLPESSRGRQRPRCRPQARGLDRRLSAHHPGFEVQTLR